MKLVRVARNVILASIAWRYIARRRALARRRRTRRVVAQVVIAGGAGVLWAARRRIVVGALRVLEVATPAGERSAGASPSAESQPGLREPEQVKPPTHGDGKAPTTSAAGASGYRQPAPSPKKRRKRARRERAEQREKTERQSAQGGKVKVEINETPELRAPLGDLKH